jgi:meso-butanediol dehydrogenase/(S,S)-butanediol dehydrogenase/diacetyl reductase
MDIEVDRAIVVTGAASGIGRALTEKLASDGFGVVAADLNEEALGWTEAYPCVVAQRADVASPDSNAEMVAVAESRFGRLDGMALNAGMPATGSIESLPLEQFDRVLDVNLRSVVLGLRAGLPLLRRSESPSVVVTASVSGLGGDPGMWAYNAAKGGVVNLVRAAAVDLGHEGIRINAACPGPTRTGMTKLIEEGAPEMYEALRRQVPLQRWGEAQEIAEVIRFLLSPAASFVTGAIIPVDGGVTANSSQFVPPAGRG